MEVRTFRADEAPFRCFDSQPSGRNRAVLRKMQLRMRKTPSAPLPGVNESNRLAVGDYNEEKPTPKHPPAQVPQAAYIKRVQTVGAH